MTLDKTDFSVTQQKPALSRFSAIRNYFWGQRSEFLRFSIIWRKVARRKKSCHRVWALMKPIFDPFFKGTRFKIVFDHQNEKYLWKNSEKTAIFTHSINWPKLLIKVWKFDSAIHNYWKIEKSAIHNRIRFIKSILVLVTWKNPLNRDFPLFTIKLYRESTVYRGTNLSKVTRRSILKVRCEVNDRYEWCSIKTPSWTC